MDLIGRYGTWRRPRSLVEWSRASGPEEKRGYNGDRINALAWIERERERERDREKERDKGC